MHPRIITHHDGTQQLISILDWQIVQDTTCPHNKEYHRLFVEFWMRIQKRLREAGHASAYHNVLQRHGYWQMEFKNWCEVNYAD
jgi:hypothetical protein